MKLMNKENLDQHFMINKKLVSRIVNYAELKKQDIILEIGPGKGALTELLIRKAFVYAAEIDEDLIKILNKKFYRQINNKKIRIIYGNALKIIKKLEFNKLVANIPYSISEPLLKQILIKQPNIVVLTTGKNFIEYLKNNELFNLISSFEVKEIVNKKEFFPEPKTESAVLKFILRQDKTSVFFQELIKQHDKKIKNALINVLQDKLTKNQVRNVIKDFVSKNKSILDIDNKDTKDLIKIIKSIIN